MGRYEVRGTRYTLFAKAGEECSLRMLKRLAEATGGLPDTPPGKIPLLHLAAERCGPELVRWLIEQGCDVDMRHGSFGDTPLLRAASEQNWEVVRLLVELGCDVNLRNGFRNNALFPACKWGHVDTVRLLIEHGIELNVSNRVGDTPLHAACLGGTLITMFITTPRHPMQGKGKVREEGTLTLGPELEEPKLETVRILIEHGMDLNATNRYGMTALGKAIRGRYMKIVRHLLEQGIRATPLDFLEGGARIGSIEFMEIGLRMAGGNPDIRNPDGFTPLFFAGTPEAVAFLVEHGADVDAKNRIGETPIYMAIRRGVAWKVKALLEAGADPYVRNNKGQTPLMVAQEEGNTEMVELLRSLGIER